MESGASTEAGDRGPRSNAALAETPFAIAQTRCGGMPVKYCLVGLSILSFVVSALPLLVLGGTVLSKSGTMAQSDDFMERGTSMPLIIGGCIIMLFGTVLCIAIVVALVGGFVENHLLFCCWFCAMFFVAFFAKIVGTIIVATQFGAVAVLGPVLMFADFVLMILMSVIWGKMMAIQRNKRYKTTKNFMPGVSYPTGYSTTGM